MIREQATREPDPYESGSTLPTLKSMVVAVDTDVDALIRSSRADIARLSLQLRVALHDAAKAEQAAGGERLDVLAARDTLRTVLEPRLAARRVERDAAIENARRQAARRIEDARDEAARIVAAARDDLLRVLLGTAAPPSAAPESRPVPPPVSPPVPPPASPPVAAQVAPVPQAQDEDDAVFRPQPPSAATFGSPAPPFGPFVPHAFPAPPYTPPVIPPQGPAVAPPAVPPPVAPSPEVAPFAPVMPQPALAPAWPYPAPAGWPHPGAGPFPGYAPPAGWPRPVPGASAAAGPQVKQSFRERFLHADVLMPLIAVVIVVIVLLAWLV